ncbi:MAG TPA: DUF3578 domain-containing protein [Methanobacterium sp.]|nr:MAG: DUF3578 domain-containing protein [Methanobacterium sp.]HOI71245.1 DUF3578 domain-containing protein [Methanobacterium sp.]
MLSDDFKEILNQYPIEKKKDIKDNPFAFKMRNDFTNDFKYFLEPLLDLDKYKIKISHGQGSWVEKPWAGITKFNSFQEGLNMGFTFFPDEKLVSLHIVQGQKKISNSIYDERNKNLIEIINQHKDLLAILERHNFTVKKPLNTEDTGRIIQKFYEYDELKDNDLKKDLEVVLEVYQKLIPKYEEMMGKKTVHQDLSSILKYTSNISNNPESHDGSYELVNKTVKYISNVNPSKLNIEDMDLLYLMTVGTFKCGWDCKIDRIENSNLKVDDKKSLIQVLNSIHGKLENGAYNSSKDHVGMFGTGFMTFKGKLNEYDARKFLNLCVKLQKTNNDEVMYEEAEKVLNKGIRGLGVGTVSQILHCLKPFTFPIINGAMQKGTTVYTKLGIELKKPISEYNYIENSKRIKKFKDTNYSFVKNYRAFDLLNFDVYTNNYINNNKNVWLLSPGENAAYWDEFRKNNIITIGWGKLGDLTQFDGDKDKILNALEKTYPKKSGTFRAPGRNKTPKQTNNAKAILDFSKEMKIGDIVFVKKGTTTLLGIGIVTSDYKFSKESKIPIGLEKVPDYNHFRDVKWLKCGEFDATPEGKMIQKTLTNITNYPSKTFEGLLYYQALGKLMDFPIDEYINPLKGSEWNRNIKYGKEDFLQEVVFLEKNYNQLVNLIKRKKNIILQGPPGVGKSFIAKRLAYSIMGCKDENRVEFIQFHQSYSYEDFIQGFRPAKDGFNLKDGVFYNFCRKAQDDQNNDYYFIIDEINRGNISKIFGELMMLIEEDKRGEKFAIHLTYSDEGEPKFFIPNNVYVIGMMNTADRSLAMIDYALRRRFVFYSVDPLFEEEDLFNNYLTNIGLEEELAKKIISRFKILNQKISEDDSLGDGFKIGHSYFCALGNINDDYESKNHEDWYYSIITYEIAPLLKEYWFDNIETAQEEIDKLIN